MNDSAAVLFDLDNTLCVNDQSDERLVADAFANAGVERYCTAADLAAVVGDVPTAESDREFYEFCFAEAARRASADPDHAPTLAAAYDDLLDHSAVSLRPGAEVALAVAADRHVALVTNGSEATQTTKLDALGIADAFDATVFADPAGGIHPKPHTSPFERALDALDAHPDETLHVGDSLAADVAGARAAGLRSVWVPYEDATDDGDHTPHHTLDSLHGLEAVL